jgi:hypothetical protein
VEDAIAFSRLCLLLILIVLLVLILALLDVLKAIPSAILLFFFLVRLVGTLSSLPLSLSHSVVTRLFVFVVDVVFIVGVDVVLCFQQFVGGTKNASKRAVLPRDNPNAVPWPKNIFT